MFTSCPQGWINSAYYMDLLLSKLFGDMEGISWVADDILIATDGTLEEHLELLEKVLQKLTDAKMRVKHSKVSILQEHTEFLGVVYNRGTMSIPEVRSQGYEALAPPTTPKGMKSFLASVNFYKRWIPKHSEITLPLHLMSLQPSNTRLKWTPEQTKAFEDLKKAIREAVALHLPRADRQFVCYSDASQYAISFVVEQVDEAGVRYPIAFLSKMLSKAECKYSIPRKEALALLYGLVAMDFWFSHIPKVVVNTDALALVWLGGCKGKNAFLTRVALQLSSYNLELRHVSGKLNLTADLMSRATKGAAGNPIETDKQATLTEAEMENIVRRLTIPEGKIFSPEEVHYLLTGESLPAPIVPPKPKTKQVRQVPIYSEHKRLPPCKPDRKINMPFTRPYHQFYPEQKRMLAQNKAEENYRKRWTRTKPNQETEAKPGMKAEAKPRARAAPKQPTQEEDTPKSRLKTPPTRKKRMYANKMDLESINTAADKVIERREKQRLINESPNPSQSTPISPSSSPPPQWTSDNIELLLTPQQQIPKPITKPKRSRKSKTSKAETKEKRPPIKEIHQERRTTKEDGQIKTSGPTTRNRPSLKPRPSTKETHQEPRTVREDDQIKTPELTTRNSPDPISKSSTQDETNYAGHSESPKNNQEGRTIRSRPTRKPKQSTRSRKSKEPIPERPNTESTERTEEIAQQPYEGGDHKGERTIAAVIQDIEQIFKEIEEFQGTQVDRTYKQLEERLTQQMVKLDGIDTTGNQNLKTFRRQIIDYINQYQAKTRPKSDTTISTNPGQRRIQLITNPTTKKNTDKEDK